MSKGKDYNRMIHTNRWLLLRRDKLNDQPLCEDCLKRDKWTPAREVHHVKPVEWSRDPQERERRMFDYSNLMSLCRDCHHRIHAEMWATRGKRKQIIENQKNRTSEAMRALFGGGEGEPEEGGRFF